MAADSRWAVNVVQSRWDFLIIGSGTLDEVWIAVGAPNDNSYDPIGVWRFYNGTRVDGKPLVPHP